MTWDLKFRKDTDYLRVHREYTNVVDWLFSVVNFAWMFLSFYRRSFTFYGKDFEN